MAPGGPSIRLGAVLLLSIACLALLHSALSFNQGSGLASIRPLSTALFPRLRFTGREKERRVWAWAFIPQAFLNKFKFRVRRRVLGRGNSSPSTSSTRQYARPVGTGASSTTTRRAVLSPSAPAVNNMPTRLDAITSNPDEEEDVLITIRYTGGVGYKPLYTGVSKVIRDKFPGIQIRKMIIAPSSPGNKKQGMFEIAIDDHVFYSKQRDSPGVYLSMKDLEDALDSRRREKAKGVAWNKLLDALEDNDS